MRKPAKENQRSQPRVMMLREVKGYLLGKGAGAGAFRAQLIDVSAQGSQIFSSKNMSKGDKVALELETLDGGRSLTFLGTVVWVRKNPAKYMGRYGYGLKFQDVTSEHRAFLAKNYALPA